MSYGVLLYNIRKKIAEMSRTNQFARWCYECISLYGLLDGFTDEVPSFVFQIIMGIAHPENAGSLQMGLYKYFGSAFEPLFQKFDQDIPFYEGTGFEAQYKDVPRIREEFQKRVIESGVCFG